MLQMNWILLQIQFAFLSFRLTVRPKKKLQSLSIRKWLLESNSVIIIWSGESDTANLRVCLMCPARPKCGLLCKPIHCLTNKPYGPSHII